MRLSTIVLSLLGLAGVAGAGGYVWHVRVKSQEWRKLVHYAEWKGCLKVDQWEEYHVLARRSVPNERESCFVARTMLVGGPGPNRRILIFTQDPARPNEMRLHLFDESRQHLGLTILPGGNPAGHLNWEGPGELSELGEGTFVFEESRDQYHYYAMLEDRPVLVKLRSMSGSDLPNNYVDPQARVGPPLPPDALDRCEALLSSESLVEILQALTWLHGRHPEGSGWAELRKRPSVDRKITELAASPKYWIAEAAKVLRPEEAARK